MEALSGYGSDDSNVTGSDNNNNASNSDDNLPVHTATIVRMSAAPQPSIFVQSRLQSSSSEVLSSTALTVVNNSNPTTTSSRSNKSLYKSKHTYQTLGPSAPASSTYYKQADWSDKNIGFSGVQVTGTAFDEAAFRHGYDSHNASGRDASATLEAVKRGEAMPSRPKVMDKSFAAASGGEGEDGAGRPAKKRKKRKHDYSKDAAAMLTSEEDDRGIWGPASKAEKDLQEDSVTDLARGELKEYQIQERADLAKKAAAKKSREEGADDETNFDRMVERKMAHLLPPRLAADAEPGPATTTFHGAAEYDYQGRPWTDPPAGVRPSDDHTCYIPKKCVHTLNNVSKKGVQCVKFSPGTGHLLLTAGLDGALKVWRVEDKKLMRVYLGHTAAVRDVCWNNDGSKFVSCSFDRYIRLWDTFTGECLKVYTTRRVPYCVRFYPRDDKFFVVGQSDNKAVTFDSETGSVTQEYNHHLAAVNSVTFVEGGRKMVTTSDDKKMLVWEWDIGVPIKTIAEPDMHSMPAVTTHPKVGFMACQSLDNAIKVYASEGRFQENRKKKFTGHQVAGFACEMTFSPSGKFLASGDGNGRLYFWDWNTGRSYARFNAHQRGPTMGCQWSPVDPSLVVTCGWDGSVKFWSNTIVKKK